eukprot:2476553-Prymnesium_polylepis.1
MRRQWSPTDSRVPRSHTVASGRQRSPVDRQLQVASRGRQSVASGRQPVAPAVAKSPHPGLKCERTRVILYAD